MLYVGVEVHGFSTAAISWLSGRMYVEVESMTLFFKY